MTGLKVLALLPLGLTTYLLSANPISPITEYGALGLCAAVVLFLLKYLDKITEQHRLERAELVASLKKRENQFITIIEQKIEADKRLSAALEGRKCLAEKQ